MKLQANCIVKVTFDAALIIEAAVGLEGLVIV